MVPRARKTAPEPPAAMVPFELPPGSVVHYNGLPFFARTSLYLMGSAANCAEAARLEGERSKARYRDLLDVIDPDQTGPR